MAEETIDFRLYRYDPSMAAAVIFVILFLIVTVLHFYQMMRTRTWILIPFVLGGICMLPHSLHICAEMHTDSFMQLKLLDTLVYVQDGIASVDK